MLKYIIVLLIVITILFFFIPKFFNFQKKENLIRGYLLDKYSFKISNISSIKYRVFPLPNLILKDVNFTIDDSSINSTTKNLEIYLNLKNILSLKDLSPKKVVLTDTKVKVEIENYNILLKYISDLEKKLKIKNVNLSLRKNENLILKLNNIYFSNYGYKKDNIIGKVFEKQFKVDFKDNYNEINFKILDTGIKADFFFKKGDFKGKKKGTSKIIVANNLFKFDFEINDNQLSLINAYIKNKDLTANLSSIIKFSPFFKIRSDIEVKEINEEFFNKIDLNNLIFKNKALIKKLNIENEVKYKSKKFNSNLINNFSSSFDLAYGRLIFRYKALIPGGKKICKGEINLIEEFPRLNFICELRISNKTKFLKKFSIRQNFEKKKYFFIL